jgi:aminodeoxyfutalosine deaminase
VTKLESLPKVELHVHLEGTVTAETATRLARAHGEDPLRALPLVDGAYPERFTSFDTFVELYLAVSRQIRTPDDLATVASAFARQQAAQNIAYTEVTFTAVTHIDNGMEARAMWAALRDGLADAGQGTEIRLIVDARRDEGPEHGERTVRLVEDADAPIAGLGLTGVEGSVPEREFKMLRDAADRMGLGLAVHAGETGGPENVVAALDDLGADRIGHGVASVRDPRLIERLARDQTPLEVCPSSNVSLMVFPSLEAHPFPDLWSTGVNVTVNSDDPPFFSTTLTRELAHAASLAKLAGADLADLQRSGARAAFADTETKERLLALIDAWESAPEA